MAYQVFFSMSSGLSKSIKVPKGTLKNILDHVHWVESRLGYETDQYRNNPKQWKTTKPKEGVSDKVYCETAEEHNSYVRWLYEKFSAWSEDPPKECETITPKDAKKFWHGLQLIAVPLGRWTEEYYKARMDAIYESLRGRPSEGMNFDSKALTIEQANAVVCLFDQYLDAHDIRLEVPKGYDALYSSDDYAWCEKCGAIHWDDVEQEMKRCRKRGGCPLKRDYADYFKD
jgi:hypothetical protein